MTEAHMPGPRALRLHADDDVAVMTTDVEKGGEVIVMSQAGDICVVARDDIPLGHKIVLRDLSSGATVRKYGEVIGVLTRAAAVGAHVHVHNILSRRAPNGHTPSQGDASNTADTLSTGGSDA